MNDDLHRQFAAAPEIVVFAELQDDFSFQTEFNLSRLALAPTGWGRLDSAAFTSIDHSPQVFLSAQVACLMRRRVDAMSRLAYKSLIERFALGCIGAFLISLLETCAIHQRTPHQFLHVVIIGWWRTVCTKRLGVIFDDVFVPRE